MGSVEKLNSVASIAQALLVLQPDGEERLPDARLGPDDAMDLSLFAGETNERFKITIANNSLLSKNWMEIAKMVAYFQKAPENREDPNRLTMAELNAIFGENEDKNDTIQHFKAAEEVLGRLEGEKISSPDSPMTATSPLPPGIATAATIETALLMFQPDEEENLKGLSQKPNDLIDFSIFGSCVNQTFEEGIKSNTDLKGDWDNKVVRRLKILKEALNIEEDRWPVHIDAKVIEGMFKKQKNVVEDLKRGAEILQRVADDERSWIEKNPLRFLARKKVLGDNPERDLLTIPPLWFHLRAEKIQLPGILGSDLYEYVLNGGLRMNDRVSYQDLAKIAETDGQSNGFFVRWAYGLDEAGKETLRKSLEALQEETYFAEYQYRQKDTDYSVQLYIDPTASFVEVFISDAEKTLALLRHSGWGEVPKKRLEEIIVTNPGNISPEELNLIVWGLQKSLSGPAQILWRDTLKKGVDLLWQ